MFCAKENLTNAHKHSTDKRKPANRLPVGIAGNLPFCCRTIREDWTNQCHGINRLLRKLVRLYGVVSVALGGIILNCNTQRLFTIEGSRRTPAIWIIVNEMLPILPAPWLKGAVKCIGKLGHKGVFMLLNFIPQERGFVLFWAILYVALLNAHWWLGKWSTSLP